MSQLINKLLNTFIIHPQAIADKGFTLSGCCGYGGDGNKASGFDCVQIPNASAGAGAVAPNTDGKLLLVNAFCGRRFVSKNEQQTQQTLCCEWFKCHEMVMMTL